MRVLVFVGLSRAAIDGSLRQEREIVDGISSGAAGPRWDVAVTCSVHCGSFRWPHCWFAARSFFFRFLSGSCPLPWRRALRGPCEHASTRQKWKGRSVVSWTRQGRGTIGHARANRLDRLRKESGRMNGERPEILRSEDLSYIDSSGRIDRERPFLRQSTPELWRTRRRREAFSIFRR